MTATRAPGARSDACSIAHSTATMQSSTATGNGDSGAKR